MPTSSRIFFLYPSITPQEKYISIREGTALISFLTALEGESDVNDENDVEILLNFKLNIVVD